MDFNLKDNKCLLMTCFRFWYIWWPIVIHLTYFREFCLCLRFISFVAFIGGQIDSFFCPTYQRNRNQTLTATKEFSPSKELQWEFMKYAWMQTAHECSLKLELQKKKKNDSDKQGSNVSALLRGRAMNKCGGAQDTFAFKSHSCRSPNV